MCLFVIVLFKIIKEKFIQENKDLIKNNLDNVINYINNEYINGLDDI